MPRLQRSQYPATAGPRAHLLGKRYDPSHGYRHRDTDPTPSFRNAGSGKYTAKLARVLGRRMGSSRRRSRCTRRRGGPSRRFYRVRAAGVRALRVAREGQLILWRGLEGILGPAT